MRPEPSPSAAPTVPTLEEARIRRIVVAVDFTPACMRAVAYARTLARLEDADVMLVHALRHPAASALDGEANEEPLDATGVIDERLEALARAFAGRARVRVQGGDAANVVLEAAEEVEPDLIVVGERRLSTVERALFGSVSGRIAKRASCPVLVVPGPASSEEGL